MNAHHEKLYRDFAALAPSVEIDLATRRYLDGLEPGRTIVEIGVGNGKLANALSAKGHEVHGVDVSPYCLDLLDTGVTRHQLDVDAAPLPFAQHSVDVIVMFNVLEHLTSPKVFLEQARTVLKPDGFILTATPNINWLPFRLYFLAGRCPEDFHNTNHYNFWNLRHFKRLFEDAGWHHLEHMTSIGIPNPLYPFTPTRRERTWELTGKYLFLSSTHASALFGFEQVIKARPRA